VVNAHSPPKIPQSHGFFRVGHNVATRRRRTSAHMIGGKVDE